MFGSGNIRAPDKPLHGNGEKAPLEQSVRDIIESTAAPIDARNPGLAGKLGKGRIDALAALGSINPVVSNRSEIALKPSGVEPTATGKVQVSVGGTEQGSLPNSDTMFGDDGNDVALWRGGDGSEAFDGGPGKADALIFGNIDRDENNIPIISAGTGRHSKTGIPTADVTNQGGFCTVERVQDPDFGYEFLVRFFLRATGNLAVTLRTVGVEQVYCTSQAGREITYADLTAPDPEFVVVSLDEVKKINPTVGTIIR